MKKSCVMILFVLMLAMPMVFAVTEVKIKTVPFSEVQIVVYDAYIESFTLIERYNGESDEYGDINRNFSISGDKFHLKVFVKKDGETLVAGEKFLDNPTKDLVYIEAPYKNVELIATPGFIDGVEIVNETEEVNETNETEIINDTVNEEIPEDTETSMTGFSVFKEEEGILSKKNFLYVGGFLFLIVVIGFVAASVKHKMFAGSGDIKVKKLSELKKEQKENLEERKEDIEDYKQAIEDAEKKIAQAQADIKQIRDGEKIKAMKKRLAEDEAELRRLEGKD